MILFRYVIKEHIGPLFVGLSALTSILLMNQIFLLVWDVVGKGISVLTVLYVLLLYLPSILALTIPMSVMVASCMSFGRLASDFEITAIRSTGINPLKLNIIPLIAGVTLTIFMIWFNNHTLPESNHRLKNIMLELAQKKPALRIKPLVTFKDFEGYYLNVGAVDYKTSKLERVKLFEKETGREIFAKNGVFISDSSEVVLILKDGEIHELMGRDRYRKMDFKEHRIYIPLDREEIRMQKDYRGERELSAKALREEINREMQKSSSNRRNKRMYSLLVEYHKKYSIPFACFAFILLGCPLAIRVKKRGIGVGFGLPLLFFIFYYICLVGGESLGDRGVVAPWLAMWFANFVLLISGAWATLQANRLS